MFVDIYHVLKICTMVFKYLGVPSKYKVHEHVIIMVLLLLHQDFRKTESASNACWQCVATLIFPVLAKYENQFSEYLEELPDADEPVWILGECYNVKTSKTCHVHNAKSVKYFNTFTITELEFALYQLPCSSLKSRISLPLIKMLVTLKVSLLQCNYTSKYCVILINNMC